MESIPPLRFTVRWLFLTPGALVALVEASDDPNRLLLRHLQGDWGEVGAADREANEAALRAGKPLFSLYRTRVGRTVRVVTDASRTRTSMTLPEESIS